MSSEEKNQIDIRDLLISDYKDMKYFSPSLFILVFTSAVAETNVNAKLRNID